MKKFWLLSIMLISLILVGCWDDTYLAPSTLETREQQKNDSLEQQNILNNYEWWQKTKEEANETPSKKQEDDFTMKEKCFKYQSEVDKEKERLWWSYAQVFYSKMYNSCLVDTFEHGDYGQTFYIYDLFNWKSIFNCTMYRDNTKDMLTYDYDKFDFSLQEWWAWNCNHIYDWAFELLQNPESEDLSVFLNKNVN